MKKSLLVLAIGIAAFASADRLFAQPGTMGVLTPVASKVVFRSNSTSAQNAGASKKIAALVEQVKASYDPKYRVYAQGEQPETQNPELEKAEREYFDENCAQLVDAYARFAANGDDDSFEEILRALGEIKYYQANSPAVAALVSGLREKFAMPNCYVEASERFLSAMARQNISENFQVNEYIRGSYARGNGTAQGVLSVDLHPNTERAEMSIVLNTQIATSTVGTSRGVDVYTDNFGNVLASKRIFVNPNGTFASTLGQASGSMKTRLNSFDANRPTPFGGMIVRNKIEQELPYAERESSMRVNRRVASELEQQTNAQLAAINQRIQRMFANGVDPMVRDMSTRSSETRLYFSCVLGRSWQMAAPIGAKDKAVQYMRELSREVRVAKRANVSPAYTQEVYVDQAPMYASAAPAYAQQYDNPGGPIATVLSAPLGVVSGFAAAFSPIAAPPLPQESAYMAPVAMQTTRAQVQNDAPVVVQTVETPSVSNDPNAQYDVVVKLHQSGPNNAVTVALAGAEFGPGSNTVDSVIARFPGVDPDDIKAFIGPYEPKETRPLDPEDNYKNVSVVFDDVRPFITRFADGKISTVLRLSRCVVDEKEWPPVELRLIYHVEKRGDSYAFVRDEVEVLPEGYQEGDAVSARFHTFRRIFIKRLEQTISNEYNVVPISLDDQKTGQKRGALIPEKINVENGWIVVGFRFDPNYDAARSEGKKTTNASSNFNYQKLLRDC